MALTHSVNSCGRSSRDSTTSTPSHVHTPVCTEPGSTLYQIDSLIPAP